MVRETTYVSLRWSEEKSLGGRAFYKHLAPNGAKGNNDLLHFKSEFANDKWKIYYRSWFPGNLLSADRPSLVQVVHPA
jgi:hypothetical protein